MHWRVLYGAPQWPLRRVGADDGLGHREAAGLATVAIMPIRSVVERVRPPRALCVEFPLGLPLRETRDAAFQHRVLDAAFALLEAPAGPVLEDFPAVVKTEDTEPLLCSLPPRYDPDPHPAVDEAQGLRHAYDRAVARNGRTSLGAHASADEIPGAIDRFARIAAGEPWAEVGLDASADRVAQDIRTYYEELACELADGPAGPWAVERWFSSSGPKRARHSWPRAAGCAMPAPQTWSGS